MKKLDPIRRRDLEYSKMKLSWKCTNCKISIELDKKPKMFIYNNQEVKDYGKKIRDYNKNIKEYDYYISEKKRIKAEYDKKCGTKRTFLFMSKKDPPFDEFLKEKHPKLKSVSYPYKPSKPNKIMGIICPVCGTKRRAHEIVYNY